MGFFALRTSAWPGEFLAVGKNIAATDAPGRNYDTLLATGCDRTADMSKMVIDILLHDRKGLGNL